MTTEPVILEFFFLVNGILQIILFFKVWRMCNDVRKLMLHFIPLKERVDAYDVKKKLKDDLDSIYVKSLGMSAEQFAADFGKTPEQALSKIKEKHAEIFADAEIPFPSDVQDINSLEGLRNWMENK